MTSPTDAIDRTESGWLRRVWEAGLAANESSGPGHRGIRQSFLLDADIPEILEPFIKVEPASGLDDGDLRILDFEGIDGDAAAALLAALPDAALEQDFSGYAPPPSVTLRVVSDHRGIVMAGGSVIGPALAGEAIRIRELTILDPTLTNGPPDVVAGALPTWIDELPAEAYTAYRDSRLACLEHGVTRQAWVTAVKRYGITEARRFPYTRLLTDEAGCRGVCFGW